MKANMLPCSLISSSKDNIDHGGRFFTPLSGDQDAFTNRHSYVSSLFERSCNSGGDIFSERLDLSIGNSTNRSCIDDKRQNDWANFANYGCNATSTPIPMGDNGQDNDYVNKASFSFPGDKSFDLTSMYSERSSLSNRNTMDSLGHIPLRSSGIRAIRANSNLNSLNSSCGRLFAGEQGSPLESCLSNRLNNSTCSTRDGRSLSPSDSDSSGVGTASETSVSNWMSNLSLGTSVTLPCSLASNRSHLSNVSGLGSIKPPNTRALANYHPSTSTGLNESCFPFIPSFLGENRWQIYAQYDYYEELFEEAIHLHRTTALRSEVRITWTWEAMSNMEVKGTAMSRKVFLGGVPSDVDDNMLRQYFSRFGNIEIEWPEDKTERNADQTNGRLKSKGIQQLNRWKLRGIECGDGKLKNKCDWADNRLKSNVNVNKKRRGYTYIIFENEKALKAMLSFCDIKGNKYYLKLPSRRMPNKDVQVIPWYTANANYPRERPPSPSNDHKRMVFVGNLHGVMTARMLYTMMNELFGNVVYAGIDIDRDLYPIGSARIEFDEDSSYMRALDAQIIGVKWEHEMQPVQIDPYLVNVICSLCMKVPGPFFCKGQTCFRYYCKPCWKFFHCSQGIKHPIVSRKRKEN